MKIAMGKLQTPSQFSEGGAAYGTWAVEVTNGQKSLVRILNNNMGYRKMLVKPDIKPTLQYFTTLFGGEHWLSLAEVRS
jgi:hypothetical protein